MKGGAAGANPPRISVVCVYVVCVCDRGWCVHRKRAGCAAQTRASPEGVWFFSGREGTTDSRARADWLISSRDL